MSIRVRFACGHESMVGDNAASTPVCGCGETRIARTFARAPRFVGACSGPYATTRNIEPGVVNLAPAGSLILKQESVDG